MGDLSGFVNAYSNVVGSLGQGVTDGNFSAFLLDKGEDDIFSYQQSMVAGANFQFNASSKPIVAKAIYNAVPLHAMPLSLNLMDNALLNYFTRDPSLEISLTNEPLERPGFTKFSEVTSQTNSFVNPDAFRYGTSLTVGL